MGLKILAWGDSASVHTGFGIVMKNLLTRWQKMGHEIHQLGINSYGNPIHDPDIKFDIWPCDNGGTDLVFGYAKFWYLYDKIKPDMIFLLNDPWLIDRLFSFKPHDIAMPKAVVYYPTDAPPIKESWMHTLNSLSAQVCYTKFAEEVVTDSNGGVRPKNLYQVYHGVNTDVFKPVNQFEARKKLKIPTKDDPFIVGMVSRNQYRKRFDILAQAFKQFAEDKPNARLYLHTAVKDVGFDIKDMIKQLAINEKVILTNDISPAEGVPEEFLNLIYNSFDVNVLISLGEGFGLSVIESMATGCPQVVSDHSALKEIIDRSNGGLKVKNIGRLLNVAGINTWAWISDVDDLTLKLNELYEDKTKRLTLAENGLTFIRDNPDYDWDVIADKFDDIFSDIFHLYKPSMKTKEAALAR